MVLNRGEKVHVVTRRLFEGDLRRHFVGEVQEASDHAARLEGYVFVFDAAAQDYIRRTDRRVRIVSLCDSGLIIIVMPGEVQLEDLEYRLTKENLLVITDGKSYALGINEFSANR
jgi:hypothetical protein